MADIEVTQVACNTSNGTQDITISGFGTPKAAMFILSLASTNGSENAPGVLAIGFTDGTKDRCISVHSEDNKASSNTARRSENACVSFDETWADDNRAIFDSWITDGVRIDWTKAPGTAWKLTVVLFGGDIQNAKVDDMQLSNSKDVAHNITTVGFEPDFVISGSIDQSSQETLASNAHLRLGLSANLATDQNRGLTWFDDDNEPAGEPHIYVSDTLCGVQPSWSWGAWAIDNYDSSGFDITPKTADGGSQYIFYLAIQGASGCTAETFAENTPTSTGDDAHTPLSAQPEFLMTLWSYADAYGSLMDSGAECETVGISVADETNEYYYGYSCDEGADPTDCNSICDDNVNAINPTRSNFVGTHKSFDASGWTWNFTSVDTTEAHKVVGLAYKGADSSQEISPTGLASGITFGTTDVSTGAVDISPSGLASGITHGATAVSSTVDVAPSGLASGIAHGTTVIGVGAVDITPTGLASGITHGSTIIGVGAVDIAPTGLVSGIAHGSTVVSSVYDITPSGLASGITHGTTVIGVGAVDISPSGVASSLIFGTTVIGVGAVDISPTGLASSVSHGSTVVSSTYGLAVSGIASSIAHGSTVVSTTYEITPSGLASGIAHGTTVVSSAAALSVTYAYGEHPYCAPIEQGQTITPTGIASSIAFGTATVEVSLNISPSGLASSITHGTTVIGVGAVDISVTGIASNITHGTTVIGVGAVGITPSGIASSVTHGTTVVSATYSITPSGLTSNLAHGTTVVSVGAVDIAPTGIASSITIGSHWVSAGLQTITPTGIASSIAFGTTTIALRGVLARRNVIIERVNKIDLIRYRDTLLERSRNGELIYD